MTNPNVDSIDWIDLHASLAQPFDAQQIKYRAGAVNSAKTKAQALPYVDPRVYEDRLNALLAGGWQVEFQPWGDSRIICRLTIHGVTRSSTGESGDGPDAVAGTSAEAQAFKRACAKFGLGRHLYAQAPRWVAYDSGSKRLELPGPESGKPMPEWTVAQTSSMSGIGPTRAGNLSRLLVSHGIRRLEQLTFARSVLHKAVMDLSQLDEGDATRVWKAATRGPPTS